MELYGLFPPTVIIFPNEPDKKYALCGGKAIEVPMETTVADVHKMWVKYKFKEDKCLYQTNIKALRGSGLYNVRLVVKPDGRQKWTCTCSKKGNCNHTDIAIKEYEKIR